MTQLHRLLWLTLLCVVALHARAAERLAVLELTGSAASEEVMVQLSDKLRSGALDVARSSDLDLDIMTRESMAAILDDMGIDAACVEGQCEVETARNLQAAYVISGSLVRLEGQYIVTTKLHGAASGSLLATQEVIAPKLLELRAGLHNSGAQLLIEGLGIAPSSPFRPVAATAPSEAQFNADFSAVSMGEMDVASRLREKQCDKDAESLGEAIRETRMLKAEQQALTNAKDAWASIEADLNMCTQLPRDERGQCIATTNRWLETARNMHVMLPATIEAVDTDCGKREVPFAQTKRSVAASDVPAAEALLTRLNSSPRRAAEPATTWELPNSYSAINREPCVGLDASERTVSGCQTACHYEGSATSCLILATMYEHGEGVRRDYIRACTYYQKACNDGLAPGCHGLGMMYQRGRGVKTDLQKARTFYKKACDRGYKKACSGL